MWIFEALLVLLQDNCQKETSSLMPRPHLGDLRMSKNSTNKSAGQLQVDRVGRRGGPPSGTEFVFFARVDFSDTFGPPRGSISKENMFKNVRTSLLWSLVTKNVAWKARSAKNPLPPV